MAGKTTLRTKLTIARAFTFLFATALILLSATMLLTKISGLEIPFVLSMIGTLLSENELSRIQDEIMVKKILAESNPPTEFIPEFLRHKGNTHNVYDKKEI